MFKEIESFMKRFSILRMNVSSDGHSYPITCINRQGNLLAIAAYSLFVVCWMDDDDARKWARTSMMTDNL